MKLNSPATTGSSLASHHRNWWFLPTGIALRQNVRTLLGTKSDQR